MRVAFYKTRTKKFSRGDAGGAEKIPGFGLESTIPLFPAIFAAPRENLGFTSLSQKCDGPIREALCPENWRFGAQDEFIAYNDLANAGLPGLGTPGIAYYAIVDGATNGSCGANAWLAASESQALDWIAATCPDGRFDSKATDCRGPGLLAHEMGHMFSLPHCNDRATCTPSIWASIMYNWPAYDNGAAFAVEDQNDLNVDAFIKAPPP